MLLRDVIEIIFIKKRTESDTVYTRLIFNCVSYILHARGYNMTIRPYLYEIT